VLRFIEWRWNLEPLTVRDETAHNLAEALDFQKRNRKTPLYPVPPGPFFTPCASTSPFAEENKWIALREMARGMGWPV
jgi:phospholipase C